MRLIAFTYDFPHEKSVEGLNILAQHERVEDVLVWAAPFVDLGQGAEPTSNRLHPRVKALELGFQYISDHHDADGALTRAKDFGAGAGVVLGARVIATRTLMELEAPVANLHPGLLPTNRGLSSVHWVIKNSISQGATAHWITPQIDAGPVLALGLIKSLRGLESLPQLQQYVRTVELTLLSVVLSELPEPGSGEPLEPHQLGTYHSRMTDRELRLAELSYESYATRYDVIAAHWAETFAHLCSALGDRYITFRNPP